MGLKGLQNPVKPGERVMDGCREFVLVLVEG